MLFLPQAAGAYLLGCVPAARYARGLAGASRWADVLEILADVLKGYLAVTLLSPGLSLGPALVATAVIAGHQWPALWGTPGKSAGTAVFPAAATSRPSRLPGSRDHHAAVSRPNAGSIDAQNAGPQKRWSSAIEAAHLGCPSYGEGPR